MEREACVCDHGFERSDLCAEIIIIIIILFKHLHTSACVRVQSIKNNAIQENAPNQGHQYTLNKVTNQLLCYMVCMYGYHI